MNAGHITCEEVIEQIFDFLDRELDHEVSGRIDAHLARCRDCFTRAEFERRLRERVRATSEAEAPEGLQRRIRAMLDAF